MWIINNINLNVVYNFVHLYSFICHLQVVSHGTIAYINKFKNKYLANLVSHSSLTKMSYLSEISC